MNKQRKTSNLINIIKYNEEDNNILDLENKEFNIDGDIYPLPNGTPSQIATLDDIPTITIPTLQEVTDEGNTITNSITTSSNFLSTSGTPNRITSFSGLGIDILSLLTGWISAIRFTTPTANNTITFKDESGTVALTSDIPTNTSDLVNDGEDGTSPYVTANQLPSNLNLFATNVSSDIATYFKLVTSIDDPDYNDTAVDIPTGAITTTGQFIAALATTANVLVGNPGIINLLTIGNVRRTSGTGTAEFYYEVYHRTSGGTETLIATSSNTIPVIVAIYTEFLAAALLNNGVFLATDRIVVKYYADRIAGGSNPSYDFQFGGASPVRTTFPVPASNIPLDAIPTDGSTNAVSSNGVFDALALKADLAIQVTPITLSAASWTLVSGLYEYDYANANITSASIVDVIPSNSTIAIVQSAGILPSTISSTGSVKLFANNLPSADIVVTFNIFK